MSETRYSQRIPESKWQLHKTTIHRLYVLENKPLTASEGVRDIMLARHGFMATKAQYETRLKKWGFYKYTSAHDRRSRASMLQSHRAVGKENDRPTGDHECDIPSETYSASRHLPIRTSSPGRSSLQPPIQAISSCSVASAASQFPISHLATGSWTPGDQATISNSSLGANATSNSSWPILTTDNITATSRIFDYRELSGNSISLSSFACETNVRDQIGWSNLWPSTTGSFTTHLSETVTSRFTGLATSQFAISIMPIILRMFPKHGSSTSVLFLGDSSIFEMAISNMSHPSTSQLIRQLGIDHQFIYMIFQRLINDGVSRDTLIEPQTELDHFFKTGIMYCFSLGEEVLIDIINATPSPYNLPLVQNMFCAALVLGSAPVLKIIMMLDQEDIVNRPFLLGDHQTYPLEYASINEDAQTTQILLDHGADPKRHKSPGYPDRVARIPFGQGSDVNARIQILRMLLDHGLKVNPNFSPSKKLHHSKDMFSMLITHCLNNNFEVFFHDRALPRILRHPAWDDSFLNTLQAILDQGISKSIGRKDLWSSVMTEALSSAALSSHTSSVDMLLNMGAIPDVHCLISAAQGNELDTFEKLLDHGLDPNVKVSIPRYELRYDYEREFSRKCDSTALSEAINNQFKGAIQVLQARGSISHSVDQPAGFASALAAACQIGDSTLVEQFLSLPNFPRREVALEKAVESAMEGNHHHIVERLLSVGIKPSLRSLELALQKKQLAVVELLSSCMNLPETLEMNQGYFELDGSGVREQYQNSIMLEALRWGNQTATECILRIGHPVNAMLQFTFGEDQDWNLSAKLDPAKDDGDRCHFTPLSAAILKGDSTAAKALIAYGAHTDLVSSRLTSHQCHMLVQDFTNFHGWTLTPLTAAVIKNNLSLVGEFLNTGLDPFDNSALFACAVLDSEEIMILLLSSFNDRYPNGAQSLGSDALYQLIKDDNLRLVGLLAKNADITGPVLDGWRGFYDNSFTSPLGEAIYHDSTAGNSESALDLLLPLVKDLNAVVHKDYKSGHMTALLYAIYLGSLKTVQKLYQAGANISLKAEYLIQRTSLQEAAQVGCKDIVQYLLAQGVSPNEPPTCRGGATALQLAAITGNIAIATILLEAGAEINAAPALFDGRTAFEGATEHGRIDMMLFLVNYGADLLSNENRQYQRAVNFAKDNLQHAAKKFADELFEKVLTSSQVTNFIGMSGDAWGGTGIDSFGGFLS